MSDIPHTGKITRQREVRFGEYVLGATLGEGEFGKVKLGWRRDGRQPTQAAIKLIRRQTIPQGSEKQSKIHREVNALKRLRHPNIVRLVEVLQNDKYIGIVLEYASGGELFDYILEHRYLKEATACRLFAQLVSGVDYMHTKGLVHRDLKLENLLLDKHKNIIISDFGFVNSFHGRTDLMRTSCGSPCYAAPELVVSSKPYRGTRVDVWSCGVILYAMLAGYLPWDDDPSNPDGENIARLYRYITSTALTFPEYIGAAPRDLLRRILVPDPHARLSLRQVRGHPWLAPHAMFLSVSPGEWDRNYRAARLLVSQPDAAHRRYSLMEAPLALRDSRRATSLMINPHSIRSRSSSKGGQPALAARSSLLLYSDPAAPHTSHTVAISRSPRSKAGTATASGSADEYDDDAGDEGDEEDDEDDELAERVSHKMHSNAPRHYRLSAAHQPHSQLSAQEAREEMAAGFAHPDTTHDISHDSTRADHPRHRRDSSSASVALQAVVAADAAERSTHGSRHSHPRPVTMAGYGSTAGTHHSSRSAAIAPIAEGSISGSAANSSLSTRAVPRFRPRASRPRPTSFQPAMVSASSAFTARDFSFLVKPVKGSAPSPRGSPVQSKRSSWCQPKISQPALDMSLVSGVLTGPGDESSGREKRHSVALDSLSSMMNSEEKAPLARSSRSESTASVYGSPVRRERADHVEGSHVKSAHTEKPHIPATHSTTQSTARSTSHSSTSTTPHTTARSTTHTSTNSEKENRTLGSVTSKFKRFSLLSFYGHDTHEPAHHRHTGHRHDERRASRKPLEPRNQSEHEQHEPSAAKRVMDFFRRRSIRI